MISSFDKLLGYKDPTDNILTGCFENWVVCLVRLNVKKKLSYNFYYVLRYGQLSLVSIVVP
jgi:hypothetical protein